MNFAIGERSANKGQKRQGWSRLFRPPSGLVARNRTAVRCEEPPLASESASVEGSAGVSKDDAPVQFEMFSKEWQQISQQDNWDGFRLEAANQVTKHLQAAHTLFLGTQLRECGYIYQFGPAFQSEDGKTMLVARVGLDGAVNGRAIRKFSPGFEFKASSNSHLKDSQRNMYEGTLEYNGSDWTCQGKLAWQGACLLGCGFSQKIIPSLHLGGDLTFVTVNGVTIGQIGARWAQGKDVFTAQVTRMPDQKSQVMGNSHQFSLNYTRKITDRLSLGSEYKYTHPDKDSGMSVAYEYTFRQARLQGNLDSDGKVSCCVSDFTGFGFSGMIDYFRGDYKFGVVMHVLPQQDQQGPM